MAGLLGLGGGSGPNLNIVPLDSGTNNLINSQFQNATIGDQALAQKYNQGVSEAGAQALQSTNDTNARAAQSGEDPAMLQAIKNQYGKVADQGIQSVVRSNQNMTAMNRAQMMDQAMRSHIAQQQVETQNFEMLSSALNAADMARAQVLSNVLGVGGMAAGMAMGGRRGRTPTRQVPDATATAENETVTGANKFNSSFAP